MSRIYFSYEIVQDTSQNLQELTVIILYLVDYIIIMDLWKEKIMLVDTLNHTRI